MLVSARHSFWTKGRQLVQAGAILDDQHPLVLRYPDLFDVVVPTMVEQATRAPGELSTARRPAGTAKNAASDEQGHVGGDARQVGGYPSGGPSADVRGADSDADGPPPKTASKAAWVEYAGGLGIDTTGMTKAAIIELVQNG